MPPLNTYVEDVSDATFEISTAAQSILVTSPNGGEKWLVGSQQNITWTNQNFNSAVKIVYSINNGSSYLPVTANASNTGLYSWPIPNTPSKNCLVKVSDASDGNPTDASNAVFEIAVPDNTQPGTNVTVDIGNGIKLTFDNVTSTGSTTVTTSNSGTPPPNGFTIIPQTNPIFYDINTSAGFSGKIKICINYDDTGMTLTQEKSLKFYVFEQPPGQWKDITTSLDTNANIICGEVNHLTEFAVMMPTNNQPVLAVTPATLDFGVSQTHLSLQINNAGTGTLNWTTSEFPDDFPFISVNPVSGAGNATVEVQVDRTGMLAGNYTSTIKVSSNGGELNVTVNMTVAGNLPIVKIDPKALNMRKSNPDSVDIVIENVTNLGGFEFEIAFDGAIVTVEQTADVIPGPFVGSNGRAHFAIGPSINNETGSLVYAVASFGNQPGPDGSGVLATITWTPQAEGKTTLDLKNVKVMDINANEIPVIEEDGEINVTTRFWADIDADDDIDIVDVQLVAAHWNSRIGDSNYDPIYDVDNNGQGDGDVDIVDVQLVASLWNKPIPPLTGFSLQSEITNEQTNNLGKTSGANQMLNLKIIHEAYAANGGVKTISIMVEGAKDIGGFQFDMEFNQKDVIVSDIQLGDFLKTGNNNISSLGPQQNADGNGTTFGAFSFGKDIGANGSGYLAIIKFEDGLKNATDFRITNFKIVDARGNALRGFSETNDLSILNGIKTIPEMFSLLQNYPNPFNPETYISFELPESERKQNHVKLYVYNMKGQLISRLVDETKFAGSYTVLWNGKNELGEFVPSGLYLYSLTVGDITRSRKMLFLK
jgi:hypothetical protein